MTSCLVSDVQTCPKQRWNYLEPIRVGTNKILDFIPILEDDERRHLESRQYRNLNLSLSKCERVTYSTDADLLRDIWLVIHIYLVELNGAVRRQVRELL